MNFPLVLNKPLMLYATVMATTYSRADGSFWSGERQRAVKISHRKQPRPVADARVNFERPAQVSYHPLYFPLVLTKPLILRQCNGYRPLYFQLWNACVVLEIRTLRSRQFQGYRRLPDFRHTTGRGLRESSRVDGRGHDLRPSQHREFSTVWTVGSATARELWAALQ